MKLFAFFAFVALATAFEAGTYHPREIGVTDGSIYVTYQGWHMELKRPVDFFNYLEIYVTGPNGFNRRVLIDNKFHVIKDFYHNNDFAQYYQQQYGMYYQQYSQFFEQDFSQFEYLLPIFRQYVGILDVNQWSQLMNTLQMEVQHKKVHFLVYEFFKHFGVNEEFFYGKYGYQYYQPYQYQGQDYTKHSFNKYFGKYYGNDEVTGISQDYYGKNYYNKYYGQNFYEKKYNQDLFGKYLYGKNYYGKQYDQGPYNQQYYGPYNQQYYAQEYQYRPYQDQYYGKDFYGNDQDFYGKYFSGQKYYGKQYDQYYGRYNQHYYGQESYAPYNSQYYEQEHQYRPYQYYGQQYQKSQFYGPYQQNYRQYYSYPQYQGQYYGQSFQYPFVWNKFAATY